MREKPNILRIMIMFYVKYVIKKLRDRIIAIIVKFVIKKKLKLMKEIV